MDPRSTVGRIYIEDHYTLLHTKYERSGTCGFGEEDFFYVFPIVSLWELSVAMETRVGLKPTPYIRLVKFELLRQIPDVYISACFFAGKLFCCILHRIPKLSMV